MSNKKQRNQNRANASKNKQMHGKKVHCPNCREELKNGGHYVPPAFGDKGGFICDTIK